MRFPKNLAQYLTGLRRNAKEATRLAQENALIAEIGRIIGSTPNIDEVFPRFFKAVAKLVPSDRIVVNLYDPQKDTSFFRYVAGIDVPGRPPGAYLPLSSGLLTAECIRTKSSQFIQPKDAREREELVARFPGLSPTFGAGTRSIIMVPLIAEDRIIGVLDVLSLQTKAYTDKDLRLVESIASQIAGVVANAQLYEERTKAEAAARKSEEEARRLAQENAIMAEIGRVISSTLNIEEVYERFAQEVHRLIPFDRIGINMSSIKADGVKIAYEAGLKVPTRRTGEFYPLAGTITEEVLRHRISLCFSTENTEGFVKRFPGYLPSVEAGLRSLMAIPLFSRDDPVGVLMLSSLKQNAYTQNDLRLAEHVANQIAGTIANAELYAERKQAEEAARRSEEEAKRLVQENAVVAEIGRIISSTLKIEEVYERLGEEVRKIIPFDRMAISVINNEDYTTHIPYVTGMALPDRRSQEVIPLAFRVTEEISRTRSSVFLQVETQKEIQEALYRFPSLYSTFQAGIRSLISVPLISGDEVIGVLHLRSTQRRAYSEKDLKMAERVGTQIAGAIANAQIFKEYIRAEVALRENQDYLENLLDSIRTGIFVIDLATHAIVDVNAFALEMLGEPKENVLGRRCYQYICSAEGGQCPVTDRGQAVDCSEDVLLKVNGDRIPVLKSVIPTMREGRGYLIESFIDISERKRAEADAISFQEQLRQSQKMEAIGKLAGGIAHDFNNLLTVIKGYNQLSLLELSQDDPLRANLEEVQQAAERAASLTRHILAFSRRQILQSKLFDLNHLLLNLDKMLRRVIGEDIELITLLSEDLGKVEADPGQIEQVVMNLAVNAKDAMPNGGKLTIETLNVELDKNYAQTHRGVAPGRYVMMAVSDTGVGMTPEVKERIFEPFFTTKEAGKGTGLGLSTVYGIVKQSRGNIWVYSEPGQGTTFKVYLPRMDESGEEIIDKEFVEEIHGGTETILVAEDEEPVRRLVMRVLQDRGYRVLEAASGDDALILSRQHQGPIHMLLTDMAMPGMSGLELSKRIKDLRREIKVLYMSGYSPNAGFNQGMLDGGMSYIQKPFTSDALLRQMRKVLDKC